MTTELDMNDFLPDEVPDGLEPTQYYELGLRYRLGGLVGLAREALTRVVNLAAGSSMAEKSSLVLRGQLPRAPVPRAAEQRNIEAYNLMASNPSAAKEKFQALMQEYPDFEWPFSNLAWMYFEEGKIEEAHGLAKYLLSVNPEHVRSIHLAMNIAIKQQNFEEAQDLIRRGRVLLGESDEQFRDLAILISCQLNGPPPDTIPEGLTAERYLELGETYLLLGRLTLAREALALVVSSSPQEGLAKEHELLIRKAKHILEFSMPKEMPPEVIKQVEEATKLSKADPEEARRILELVVTQHPDLDFPPFSLAVLWLMSGNLQRAERFVKISLKRNPKYRNAKLLLIQILRSQQQFDLALKLIDQEIKSAEPDDMRFDLLRAECQLAQYQA